MNRKKKKKGNCGYGVSLRIQSECGKNADQNNSGYGYFLRSVGVVGLTKSKSASRLANYQITDMPL